MGIRVKVRLFFGFLSVWGVIVGSSIVVDVGLCIRGFNVVIVIC